MGKFTIFILFSPLFLSLYSGSYNFTNYTKVSNFKNNESKCSDCHATIIEKETKHPAAIDDGCTNCHQSNDSIAHPKQGAKTFTLVDKMPDLCFSCHDGIKTDITTLKTVHQIVNQKKLCLNCHSPHSSSEKKLLISEEKALCLSCHNREIKTNNRKIENINQTVKNSKNIHAALEGGCLSCHKPHASENNFLLNKTFPSGQYSVANKDSFALCFDCHDSGLLETEKTISSTGFRNGDKNLHFLHINGEKGRSCIMCHSVHASNNEHLILDKVQFGNWSFNLNYKSTQTGGSCAPSCHGEKTYNKF